MRRVIMDFRSPIEAAPVPGADGSSAPSGTGAKERSRTVLHVLDHSLPVQTGYTFRSRNIFRCQREIGFYPVVLTSSKHEESAPDGLTSPQVFDGIPYYRSGKIEEAKPVLREAGIMRRTGRCLERLLKALRPVLLHAHSPVLNALPALAVGRKHGIPVVYEIRAFWEDAAVDHGTHREWGPRYRLIRALETLACRKADAVVTICQGLRADLLARGVPDGKITVVPNAVDPEELQPVARDPALRARFGAEGDDFLVAFIGSFYHYEGLDLLMRALALLPRRRPHIRGVLIGGGKEEGRLRSLVRELGLADRVIFAGRIPHDLVPAAYAACDALVLPRKSMRLTELVTPLKPLEAMAMGVPVIASDVGGHRELIRDGETGLLFPAHNAHALAKTILTISSNPDLAGRLVERAKGWVLAERTWRRNAQKYETLYKDLLGTGDGDRRAWTTRS